MMRSSALDDVAQLAHVAGPGVRSQQGYRILCQQPCQRSVKSRVFFENALGKRDYIIVSVPKRRQVDGHDVESIVQIFPESPLAYGLFQIFVRRCKKANRNRQLHSAAPPA